METTRNLFSTPKNFAFMILNDANIHFIIYHIQLSPFCCLWWALSLSKTMCSLSSHLLCLLVSLKGFAAFHLQRGGCFVFCPPPFFFDWQMKRCRELSECVRKRGSSSSTEGEISTLLEKKWNHLRLSGGFLWQPDKTRSSKRTERSSMMGETAKRHLDTPNVKY